MKVNFSNTNFNARNPMVRKADQISRRVSSEFPAISSSKVIARCKRGDKLALKNNPNAKEKYKQFLKLDGEYFYKLCKQVREPFNKITGIVEEGKFLKQAIKEHKVANCAELVRLTEIACAVNGIKSRPVEFTLSDKSGSYLGPIDHIALAIPLKDRPIDIIELGKLKNVIIIDPWFGIADYAPNLALAYENEFPEFLDLEEHNKVWVNPYTRNSIPQENFAELKKEFPELIVK